MSVVCRFRALRVLSPQHVFIIVRALAWITLIALWLELFCPVIPSSTIPACSAAERSAQGYVERDMLLDSADLLRKTLQQARAGEFHSPAEQERASRAALQLSEALRDTLGLVQSYAYLSSCCIMRRMLDSALFYCQKALNLASTTNNPLVRAVACGKYAEYYRTTMRYDSSRVYGEAACRLALQAGDTVRYAMALGNLGQVLVRQRKYEEGLVIFQRILSIFERFQAKGDYVETLSRIGFALSLQGKHKEAIPYFERLLAASREEGFAVMRADGLSTLGSSLFHTRDYSTALPHLLRGLQIADSLRLRDVQQEISLTLSRVYEALGQHDKALRSYKKFVEYFQAQMQQDGNNQQLLEMQRFEQALQDQQVNLLQREADTRRLQQAIIIIGMIVLLVFVVLGVWMWRQMRDKAARERDELLRLFSEYTSDVITRHDLAGLYQYISPSITGLLGYEPEELLGRNPYPFIHPDDVPAVKDAYKTMLNTRSAGIITVRFLKKSGEYCWIEVMFKPILHEDGTIKEFIHTSRDVSARVAAEQKLRASEEALRATLYNTPNVAIQWFDIEGRIVLWNTASERIFGYTEEEARGKTLDMLIHTPDDARAFEQSLREIRDTAAVLGPFQYQFHRKDGSTGFGQSTTFAIPASTLDASGAPAQELYVCMDVDITAETLAQQALEQAKTDLDTMLSKMSVGVAVNIGNRYVFTNATLQRILGYSQEEFQELHTIEGLIHPDYHDLASRRYNERLLGIHPHTEAIEVQYRHRSGEYIWVQVSGLLITYQGKQATLITFVDITERKQAETALKNNEERLRSIVEAMSEGLLVQDRDYRIVFANTALARFLDTTTEEMYSTTIFDQRLSVIHEDGTPFNDEERPSVLALQTGAAQANITMGLKKPDNTTLWMLVNARPIIHPGETAPANVVSTFTDITSLREAELALKENEKRLHSIVNALSEGLLVQNTHDEILFSNQSAATILGLTQDQLYGRSSYDPLWRVVHEDGSPFMPDDRPSVETLKTGKPTTGVVMGVYKPSGELSWITVNAQPMFSNNEPLPSSAVITFADITQRKNAEIALRESEERLRSIVSALSEGLVLQRRDGTVTFCNPAAARILGVEEEDLLGRSSHDFQNRTIHEDGSRFIGDEHPAMRVLATCKPVMDVVMGVYKPNGSLAWISINARPIFREEDGNMPSSVVVTYTDITTRRAAENRLQERELQLTALIESTSDVIYSLDKNYRLLIFNSRFKQYIKANLGVDAEPGMNILSVLTSEIEGERELWKQSFDRVLKGEQYTLFYTSIITKRHIEIMFNPIKNDIGEIVGIVAFNRDITAIKHAEERLRRSEELLRQTSEIARVGGWEINFLESPPQMTWTETSYTICELLPDAPLSIQIFITQFCPSQKEQDLVWDYLQSGVHNSTGFDIEILRHTARGREVWVRIIGNVERDGDHVQRLYGTIQDVSQRKETELLIQEQLQALETKTAEMERFIYTVSHDLKSPLITIKGFLGMIQEDVDVEDYRRIGDDLLRIDNAANKMQHLLEDLLELSRVGRVINPSEEFSMSVLAKEVVEVLHGILTQRNVRVSIQHDMPIIWADKERFREVYQNLIENATKFMGNQTTPLIEIGVRTDDLHPIFFVRDNGIGIAKEYHEKIFGLFDKLDQRSDGTGIGLALIKRIIELHGGRIWVESELGQGTTFFFTCQMTKPIE